MRLFILMALLALTTTTVFAEPAEFTGLPVPALTIAELTVIHGTGWSHGSSQNQSLACDVAHQRAITQLTKGIAVAKSQRLVTAEELTVAIIKPAQQVWNATEGRCTVQLELTIPVIPRTRVHMVHDRQY